MSIILGVDPDKGISLVKDKKILFAKTVKGMTALEKIIADVGRNARYAQRGLLVRIERPTNTKVFPRPGLSHAAMLKIARNVGMNYSKCEELGRYCADLGLRYEFVLPARRKLSAKEVKEITGYQGRTSQHSRDAIILATAKGQP